MYHFELKPFRRQSWNSHTEWDKDLEKFFDTFSKTDYFAPVYELSDEENSYCLSMDIPGLKKEDLEIEVKDTQLIISGERKNEKKTEKDNILKTERRYGKFSRVFNLPKNINTDKIEARFENGVLDIVIPKEEKSQGKKILISDAAMES